MFEIFRPKHVETIDPSDPQGCCPFHQSTEAIVQLWRATRDVQILAEERPSRPGFNYIHNIGVEYIEYK